MLVLAKVGEKALTHLPIANRAAFLAHPRLTEGSIGFNIRPIQIIV
jgi:hypothetical protein